MIFELLIEKQGFQGDGIGFYHNQKVIVPLAVKGDYLKVRQIKKNNKFILASIVEILEPSKERAVPPCKYFGICGGCNMQHLSENLYKETKLAILKNSLSRAGINNIDIKFIPVSARSRRKAVFHAKNGLIGFYRKNTHEIVTIDSCEVLSDKVMQRLSVMRKNQANHNGIIEIVESDIIEMTGYSIPYNGYFLQASRDTNKIIADLILPHMDPTYRVADLFSGIGAYSFYIHKSVKLCHAFDGDDKIESIITETTKRYNIANVKFYSRDLFKNPLQSKDIAKYDVIIINPPKNGAEPEFIEIANSGVKEIYIISCNPVSLERDLAYLVQKGYKAIDVVLIDQFKWSSHVEVYIRAVL